MAKFELPIYGKDDEVIKTFTSNICPWDVYIEAAAKQEEFERMPLKKQFEFVENILKAVFTDLTNDDLKRADANDVMNTYLQICRGGNKIRSGNPKNA